MGNQIIKGHMCFQAKCNPIQSLEQLRLNWLKFHTCALTCLFRQGTEYSTELFFNFYFLIFIEA